MTRPRPSSVETPAVSETSGLTVADRSKAGPSAAVLLAAAMLFTIACGGPADDPTATDAANVGTSTSKESPMPDPHSYSRPDEVAIEHLDLDLTVDFESQRLSGRASLRLADHQAERLILDTRDLDVAAVFLDDAETAAEFELGAADPALGQSLTIPITAETQVVHVDYASRPEATAVQWLDPAQTAGGESPFLFTQSQAILARTWVPCQDTPGVRFTYEATVRVPSELIALMSAENPTEKTADGVYTFSMPQAIPSYLLALAVGDLEFRPLGDRAGVYAEPSVVEAAAYEFAETPDMMAAVEPLYGPYLWGRYDILVLPPSFPFGGMENPRLTFATPTILAGDRSLVSLIAHELAHSWSGNLVTNATWDDFWLNEGFTVYLERRIMEAIEGPEYAAMLSLLGRQDLDGDIADLTPRDTHLRLDLQGRDPDEGMTDVAYEKGYFFLRTIEEAVGRERFDAFLRAYFDRYAFKSLTTDAFLAELRSELVAGDADLEAAIQIDAWVDGPGVPDNAARATSEAFTQVEAQIASWGGGQPAAELATEDWNTHQWLHFLRGLPEGLSEAQMADLDGAFGFTTSGNSEVLHAWFHHVIANGYGAGEQALEDFLVGMGRRKFLEPLYRRLAGTPEGLERAKAIYAKARPGYHSVSSNTIDALLDWQG